RPDPAERADGAQAGHEQIKDDRLRLPSLQLQERLDAVGGGEHHESLLGEVFLEQLQDVDVVVHAQDARQAVVHGATVQSKKSAEGNTIRQLGLIGITSRNNCAL